MPGPESATTSSRPGSKFEPAVFCQKAAGSMAILPGGERILPTQDCLGPEPGSQLPPANYQPHNETLIPPFPVAIELYKMASALA